MVICITVVGMMFFGGPVSDYYVMLLYPLLEPENTLKTLRSLFGVPFIEVIQIISACILIYDLVTRTVVGEQIAVTSNIIMMEEGNLVDKDGAEDV